MSEINWCSDPDRWIPGTFQPRSPASPTTIPNGAILPYGSIPPPPPLSSLPDSSTTINILAPPAMPPPARVVDRDARPSWFYIPSRPGTAPPVASPPLPSSPPPTYIVSINYAPQIQAPPPARARSVAPTTASSRSHTPSSASRRNQMSPPPTSGSRAPSQASHRSMVSHSGSRSGHTNPPTSGSRAPSQASHRSMVSHSGSRSGHASPPPRYEATSRPPIGLIGPAPPSYNADSLPPRLDYIQRPSTALVRVSNPPAAAPQVPAHAPSHASSQRSHNSRSGTSHGSHAHSLRVPPPSVRSDSRSVRSPPPSVRSDSRSMRGPPPSASAASRNATPSTRGGSGQVINISWEVGSDHRSGSGASVSSRGTLRPEDSYSNVWAEEERQRSLRDDARREERRAGRR